MSGQKDSKYGIIFLVTCALMGARLQPIQAQYRIGDVHKVAGKGTPRPYLPADVANGIVWSESVKHPGAMFIKVKFEDFDLAPGDYIVVRDAASTQVDTYDSSRLGTFWSGSIFSDEVIIELHSTGQRGANGLVITEYAESMLAASCAAAELCLVDVECMPPVGTPAYPLRVPVCAVIGMTADGMYGCSCYQIAIEPNGPGFILTNQHCKPSDTMPNDWRLTEVWFNYERTGCASGGLKTIARYWVDPICCSDCKALYPDTGCGDCLRQPGAPPDPMLDYALLHIAPMNPPTDPDPSVWGHLPLRNGPPVIHEPIYHFQHSRLCQKQFEDGEMTGPSGNVPGFWDYTSWIDGGSSGSPVIGAVDGCVNAHHGYGYYGDLGPHDCHPGKGSAMEKVYQDMVAQNCLPPWVTTCGPVPETCCFPTAGGGCGATPPGTCEPAGGRIIFACAGDADGNTIDDACEELCCYPVAGGSCGRVPVGTCKTSGGNRVAACLGDANLNGINDACEPTETCCQSNPPGGCGEVPIGTCTGVLVPGCLGDNNGNGIDEACDYTENCCQPFAGGGCGPVPVGTCTGVVVAACLGDANGDGIDDACGGGAEICCHPTPGGTCGPAPQGSCAFSGGVIVGACQGDNNGDGIDDACGMTPCINNVDCALTDANVCTCDNCHVGLGFCFHDPIRYGNANCSSDQLVNLDDILCVLAGFANFANCVNGDLAPPCTGNDVINIDDILAVLSAFAGNDPCSCP